MHFLNLEALFRMCWVVSDSFAADLEILNFVRLSGASSLNVRKILNFTVFEVWVSEDQSFYFPFIQFEELVLIQLSLEWLQVAMFEMAG